MKCLCISAAGFEDISKKEVKELLEKDSEIIEGGVIFDATKEELAKFAYTSQSAARVIELLDNYNFLKNKKFCIDCIKVNSDKSSPDMIEEAKENIIDRKSTRLNSSHIPLSRMPSSA